MSCGRSGCLLNEEYNSLGGAEMRYPAETAVRPGEMLVNILPYDRSRVVLSAPRGTWGQGTCSLYLFTGGFSRASAQQGPSAGSHCSCSAWWSPQGSCTPQSADRTPAVPQLIHALLEVRGCDWSREVPLYHGGGEGGGRG